MYKRRPVARAHVHLSLARIQPRARVVKPVRLSSRTVVPVRRCSVFKRKVKASNSCGGSTPTPVTTVCKVPQKAGQKRPQYIRRELFMASKTGAPNPPPMGGGNKGSRSLRTIFSPPLRKLSCPWATALLFRDAPGFFRYADSCSVSPESLEACFRTAIGKRCATMKTQARASGFVSSFVMYAVSKKSVFYGDECLFILVDFLSKLRERGPSVPGVARWAIKVYEEILNLVMPLQHPAVVAVTGKNRSGIPKPVKQAPMLELKLILDLERVASDNGCPMGMRFYASAYLLMVFASLRFSDCKAVFDLWTTDTAVCGRSLDLKLKTRPVIAWATPIKGINSDGKWVEPLFKIWKQHPLMEGGHHSLYRFSDESWSIDVTRRPPYYAVLKMFRKLCEHMGYEKPVWTLHSARAWFPTCAAQLGWSEDDRRRLGHWAPGSAMMETYDRAFCTSELRLRSKILGNITIDGWQPTKEFEVPQQIGDANNVQNGGSPSNQATLKIKDSPATQEVAGLVKNEQNDDVGESGDESSTSSVTWDNESVLSEVDIADLYGDLQ